MTAQSTDLVSRLRTLSDVEEPRLSSEVLTAWDLLGEAADEIDLLRALIRRVIEWEPALPVESSLLDELATAAGDKPA